MKHLSLNQLATIVANQREKKHLTQAQLSEQTGIHRTMIGRIERNDYMPTIPQLEKLAEVLGFRPEELWQEDEPDQIKKTTSKKTKKTKNPGAGDGPFARVAPTLSAGWT